MKKLFSLILIFIFICIAIVIGVLKFIKVDTDSNSNNKDSIIYSVDSISTNINKKLDKNISSRNIIAVTSRGLVKKDIDGNITTDLAAKYEISEDGIEYVFYIDSENAFWSNGEHITAQDFVDFFKELISAYDEETIKGIYSIYGVKEYKNNNCTFENTGIACSENKLKIRLNSKDDNFLSELTKIQYRLRCTLKLWNDIFNNYKDIKYSGSFFIDAVDYEKAVLKSSVDQNDEQLNTLILMADESKEIAMAQFEIGERDIIKNPPKNYIESIYENEKLISTVSNKNMMIKFNEQENGLSINQRKSIYKMLYKGVEEYYRNHMYYIEPSEGVYTLEEKNNTSLVQSRKVIINNFNNKNSEDINEISIIAEDTAINRFWTQYFKEYLDTYNISVKETYVDSKEINSKDLLNKFDILLYESDSEEIKDINYDNQFNECTIRNLMFFYDNTAVSEYASKINFDWYGDIII